MPYNRETYYARRMPLDRNGIEPLVKRCYEPTPYRTFQSPRSFADGKIKDCLITFDPGGILTISPSIVDCLGLDCGSRLYALINPHVPQDYNEETYIELIHFKRITGSLLPPATAHDLTVDSESRITLHITKDSLHRIPRHPVDEFEILTREDGDFFLFKFEGSSPAIDSYHQGNERLRGQEYIGAIDSYSKAIRVNRRFREALANRAICMWDFIKESPEEVIDYITPYILDDYGQALSIDPLFATAYMNRGWMYYELVTRYSDSIEKVNSANKTVFKLLGDSLVDLTKAIELEPDNPEALIRRAYLHRYMNRLDRSIDDLELACKLGSEEASTIEKEFREELTSKTTATKSEEASAKSDQLKAFLNAVTDNDVLQAQLEATTSAHAIVEIAESFGFAITSAELAIASPMSFFVTNKEGIRLFTINID